MATHILIFHNPYASVIRENHRRSVLRTEVPVEMWYQRSTLPDCLGTEGNKRARRLFKHIYARLLKNAVLNKHALISIQMDFLADFQMRSVDGQQVGRPN